MPFIRSLMAAVITHWIVSELLLNLVNSEWTIILSALWLLIGYRRIFGKIPGAESMRDAGRAVLMAWLWPIAPKR
jgi:hypothetical protein